VSGDLKITRTVRLPDPLQLARFKRAPELGPRILFFSGGSALNPLSRTLIEYTHNSIHLITPFDSGGSSASLRRAFHMPAVGDLRNRMMALADQSVQGNPDIFALFSYRFPKNGDNLGPRRRLGKMVSGHDPLVAAVPDPMRKIIRTHLKFFQSAMPAGFDLRGASIGNLVLVGGYLNHSRHLDPVMFLFSKLAEVRGVVRPVINKNLHLAAQLADGRIVIGQHLITGREVPPLDTAITRVFLSRRKDRPQEMRPAIRRKIVRLIQSADLICYPMGSYFSSLMAALTPDGVAAAVAANECPKVFIPNTGRDSELIDQGVAEQVDILIEHLTRHGPGSPQVADLLHFVLVDSKGGQYPGGLDREAVERRGVRVIDTELVTPASRPLLDERRLGDAILSLA
jgi:CofD-related protein of GAK system